MHKSDNMRHDLFYFIELVQIRVLQLLGKCKLGNVFCSLKQIVLFIFRAYLKKTLKRDSFYDGCVPLVSPILLFTLISIWVTLSPCDILAKQTRMFFWMLGVTFSNILVSILWLWSVFWDNFLSARLFFDLMQVNPRTMLNLIEAFALVFSSRMKDQNKASTLQSPL